MPNSDVGAGILSVITESLYDNPIVVFREYVQNSIDSIFKEENHRNHEIQIWSSGDDLFFLDNGRGIETDVFQSEMKKIGASTKKKQKNLGYKGIGRLSGVPYCGELQFVNIYNYSEKKAQLYSIDGGLYEEIKNSEQDVRLSFSDLMDKIGTFEENVEIDKNQSLSSEIGKSELLERTNTGFLVALRGITSVLKNTINADDFFENLQWLLPVDFDRDLYSSEPNELFRELTDKTHNSMVPIKYCKISYNEKQIFRPIKKDMLRDYVCKNNFKYAMGFHTFNGDRIYIDRNNRFSGIRIYIDNMLLCDENELIQSLDNYGLLEHTVNGQVQSVRGIGAMIYITDKVNISANARRTFIEVMDSESLEFLKLLAEFVNTIYDTRYALSNYVSARNKQEKNTEKLLRLKSDAINNLRKLAKEDVELTEDTEDEIPFDKMSVAEKKREIKKKIRNRLDQKLKEYLRNLELYDLKNAYSDFITWLQKANPNGD